jgi:hypothetical protein
MRPGEIYFVNDVSVNELRGQCESRLISGAQT